MAARKNSTLDAMKEYFEYGILAPQRTLYCDKYVDETLAEYVIKGLNILESVDASAPIRIILNSNGGDEYDGLAVYDYIRKVGKKATVVVDVYGTCMSMGVWILQAAHRRRMSPNARMMIHTGYSGLEMNHPEINKRWMKQWEKDEKVFEDILLERMSSEWTRAKLKKALQFDTIYTPEEALKHGLIDEVIE